jgi:hypothetical protein
MNCSNCFNENFCESIGRCFRQGFQDRFDSDVTDMDELNEIPFKKKKIGKPDKINNFDERDFLTTLISS